MAKPKGLKTRAEAARARPPLYSRRQANRISLWVVIAAAIVLVGYFCAESLVDPVSVSDGQLSVSSLFGFSLKVADIKDLKLNSGTPSYSSRDLGIDALGLFREGDFEVNGVGKTRLFVKRPYSSYVLIQTAQANYAIGLGTLVKDRALYDSLASAMKTAR